jgi:hypothetical protein
VNPSWPKPWRVPLGALRRQGVSSRLSIVAFSLSAAAHKEPAVEEGWFGAPRIRRGSRDYLPTAPPSAGLLLWVGLAQFPKFKRAIEARLPLPATTDLPSRAGSDLRATGGSPIVGPTCPIADLNGPSAIWAGSLSERFGGNDFRFAMLITRSNSILESSGIRYLQDQASGCD